MSVADDIRAGRTSLGIELGSTRIKACLIGEGAEVLATGSAVWESRWEHGTWTYALADVWAGVQAAYAGLVSDAQATHGVRPTAFDAIGVSAMMHGYLAFDATGAQLAPFRTWRNTDTAEASAELRALFGVAIPLRWSIAHLHQAVRRAEQHLPRLDFLTTLAGYVHWQLTGERVLGIGDASGMFPIDRATGDYDRRMLDAYDRLAAGRLPAPVRSLLPEVRLAGRPAGMLTVEGARLLDPTGVLRPGAVLCPPEGDAGTGMVATNAVTPRTGNVSVGTSIFAMVVLEHPLTAVHEEVDVVTTPAGDPVAMVHCNNGAGELGAWAALFGRFAAAAGAPLDEDAVFALLLGEALDGDPDAGGVFTYGHVAGEPVVGLDAGRPLVVRDHDSALTLANFARSQLYGVFGALALGMRALAAEGVDIARMHAHGGLFRTAGVAQRFLAAALGAPVTVGAVASEGGAWGVAVLASYLAHADSLSLDAYLDREVFAAASWAVVDPDPVDVAGFSAHLDRYHAGIAIETAAVAALPAP